MAISDTVANWVALVGAGALGVGAYRDWRKQTIAGSLPTEYTRTLQERVGDLEERLDRRDAEYDAYRRATRAYYYAFLRAQAAGTPLPAPPPDWP